MTDDDFRDACAASALGGLIARFDGDDEDIRHHFHVMALEALRAADEIVEARSKRIARAQRPD